MADAPHYAAARFGHALADRAAQAVYLVVVLDGHDLADVRDATLHRLLVQGLYRVHVEHPGLYALLVQDLRRLDGQAQRCRPRR